VKKNAKKKQEYNRPSPKQQQVEKRGLKAEKKGQGTQKLA